MQYEDARMLVSEAIKNQLSESDLSGAENGFIMVDVLLIVGENLEPLNGTLFSCVFLQDKIELELRVLYEDAFGLSEAWSLLKIKEFFFTLGGEKICHRGEFSIASFGIKNLSLEQRTCVISLQLIKA